MMPRDVATRWHSTYDMLVFALKYRKAIDEISHDRQMRKYELLEEEWELIQQLCDVLRVCCTCHLHVPPLTSSQIFKDATLFFSRSTPNLPIVIPAMDHINAHLATASQNSKYSPAIQASLKLRKAHLNKYYNMTDHSEVYQIAMSEFIFWITLFNYNYLEQSYIHDTNFNISTRPTGTTRGLPPQTQLSVMSLCEHTQTSLMRLSFARGMYVFPSNFFLC